MALLCHPSDSKLQHKTSQNPRTSLVCVIAVQRKGRRKGTEGKNEAGKRKNGQEQSQAEKKKKKGCPIKQCVK